MRDISAILGDLCEAHQLDFDGASFEVSGRTLYVRGIDNYSADGIYWGRWEWDKIRGLTDVFDEVIIETEGAKPLTLYTHECGQYLSEMREGVQAAMIDINFRDGIYLPHDNTGIMTASQLREYVKSSSAWLALTAMDSGRVIAVSESYGQWTDRTPEEWEADTGNLSRWHPDSLAQTISWLENSQGILTEHTTLGTHCKTGQLFEWECQIQLVHYGNVRCRLTQYAGRREANLAMV